jgi:hypothetical protein
MTTPITEHSARSQDDKHRAPAPEITTEMIEAGCVAFATFDPRFHDDNEAAVSRVPGDAAA